MPDLEQSLSVLTPQEIDEIVVEVATILRELREHEESRRQDAAQKEVRRRTKPARSTR